MCKNHLRPPRIRARPRRSNKIISEDLHRTGLLERRRTATKRPIRHKSKCRSLHRRKRHGRGVRQEDRVLYEDRDADATGPQATAAGENTLAFGPFQLVSAQRPCSRTTSRCGSAAAPSPSWRPWLDAIRFRAREPRQHDGRTGCLAVSRNHATDRQCAQQRPCGREFSGYLAAGPWRGQSSTRRCRRRRRPSRKHHQPYP